MSKQKVIEENLDLGVFIGVDEEKIKESKIDYEKAYWIMADYFDSISDEEKPEVDKKLKECGL